MKLFKFFSSMGVTKKYMVLSLFFCFLLIFVIPILHGIDEVNHFYRIYYLLENGKSIEKNGVIYDNIPKEIDVFSDYSHNKYSISFYRGKSVIGDDYILSSDYSGGKLYSLLSYLPYIIPMVLSLKIFHLNITLTVLLMRFCGVLMWVVVSCYCLKRFPFRKDFIAFLMLVPVQLTVVSSITGI